MIAKDEMKWRLEFPEPWKNTVITFELMVDHVSKMKNCIQWLGIEFRDAAVELCKRKHIIPITACHTIAILAIGKDPDPDSVGSLTED